MLTASPEPQGVPSVAVEKMGPLSPPVELFDFPDPTPWPRLNPTANTRRAWLLAEGPARGANPARRLVTFTFDDGPFPETTPSLLRMLERHRIRATFFLIGRYLEGEGARARATREVARQIVAAGHAIGNHTEDHLVLTQVTHSQVLAQIDDAARAIEQAVGHRPKFFRPPYGALDSWTEGVVEARGLDLVLWSIEAGDMQRIDVDEMAQSLIKQLDYSGGGIVLLHDIRWTTLRTFEKLLEWLELRRFDPSRPLEKSYDVVDLETYLRATAERPQPFVNRQQLADARCSGVLRNRFGTTASLPKKLGYDPLQTDAPSPIMRRGPISKGQ